MAALSREAQLLLHIARPTLDEATRESIRSLIRSGLDWDLLHHIVTRHRLGMFLYVHLSEVAAPEVPRPVFMDLWKSYEENRRRNERRVRELERIVTLFEGDGVRVVPYKGVMSAHQIFGDIALREFEDLDVLVRSADLARVKELLLEHGYRTADTLDGASEAAMYQSREQYHRVFIHGETHEKLEVHWKTDPRFPVERTRDVAWWEALPRVTLREIPLRTFSPSEQLIILCLHGTKHQGHRLGWTLEIAELIRHQSIDWDWVEATIARLGCRRRVLVSLLLARDWTAAELPSRIDRAITSERAVGDTAALIADRFFTTDIEERQSLDRLRLDLKLCDRLSQRFKYVADVALTPTTSERATYRLPVLLAFLYVPLRVARLAVKYARRA